MNSQEDGNNSQKRPDEKPENRILVFFREFFYTLDEVSKMFKRNRHIVESIKDEIDPNNVKKPGNSAGLFPWSYIGIIPLIFIFLVIIVFIIAFFVKP